MKQKVFHYGCSFSQNIKGFALLNLFSNYDYSNFAEESLSNSEIYDLFEKNTEPNSIAIIQWSSITRPSDANFPFDDKFNLIKETENPLYDLLEDWYVILDKTQKVCSDKNIKLVQYIGWAHWKDSELNDYHRNRLKSFGIDWFTSKQQHDKIQSNCFQFEIPQMWSSKPDEETGLFLWQNIEWGGISEWIRENVEMEDRYLGYGNDGQIFDVHPSKKGKEQFIKGFLLPKIDSIV